MSHSSESSSLDVETFLSCVYDIIADSVRNNPDKWSLENGTIKAPLDFAGYGLRRRLHQQAYEQKKPAVLQLAGVDFRRSVNPGSKTRFLVRTKEEVLTAQPDGTVCSKQLTMGFGLGRENEPYIIVTATTHRYGKPRRVATVDLTTERRTINSPTSVELQTALETVRRVCSDVNRLAPPPEMD